MGFAEKDRILGFYQVSYQLYKHEENQRMMMEIEKEMKLLEKWRLRKRFVFLDNLNLYFKKNKKTT